MTYRRSRPRLAALAGALAAVLIAAPATAGPDIGLGTTGPDIGPASAAGVAPTAPGSVWTVNLSVVDADDVNVRATPAGLRLADLTRVPAGQRRATAEGMLLAAPHQLGTPANRIHAALTADTTSGGTVEVAVRGWQSAGWTEWLPTADGAVFDQRVSQVQARLTLTAGPAGSPTVRGLRLVADSVAATSAANPGLTYRVYATREGLVGGTTANGHVIVSRDHFVALPSARGLSAKNAGDYTVRVCTTSGSRCEYAPVWDVGPWNTTDDYWNPSATRQSWKDLPQGRPEAQAAYQNGYNGGKDQFGRKVANPAGIDLADGTFWDGLLLTDNAWVDVAFLWTGSGPRGRIGSGPLNIRTGPSSTYASKGYAATYANVPIECWVTGQSVSGTYGTTTRWNRIASGQFISHAYVSGVTGTVPAC